MQASRRKFNSMIAVAVACAAAAALMLAQVRSSATAARVALPPVEVSASDSLLRLAEIAMSEGRPWRATEILAPVVENSATRTPAAVIIAARAAVAWGGWSEAARILRRETWLDSLYSGEGRLLLARAQLGTGTPEDAATNATIALALAETDEERGRRTVLRALARAASGDAAGAVSDYAAAAELIPAAGDWLRLRAVEWEPDSAARTRLLTSLTLPHAQSRARLADARASENTGDTTGAIRRYAALGDMAAVLRLKFAAARTGADSVAVRGEIVGEIRRAPATARVYAELLGNFAAALSAEDNLLLARALGASGGERAAAAYSRALRGGAGTSADRFQYATILARLGRNAEAIAEFGRVSAPPPLAAAAAYQRARTMLRSDPPLNFTEALRGVVRDHPTDTSAATALFLLADLATDNGRDADARRDFLESARRFPRGSRAPAALFAAAMNAYVMGSYDTAATEFAALRAGYPLSSEATPALYWSGRALERTGDSTARASTCVRIRATDSLSYYAALCAAKFGTTFWHPAPAADTFITLPEVDSIAARIIVLRDLELTQEVVIELERIRALATGDVEVILSAANTLRSLGEGNRALALAQLAQTRGAPRDARLYKLLYPAAFLEMIAAEAEQYGVDVNILSGLIRQESLFNPAATSPAGARGLMQVMPAVGGDIARAFSFPLWDPVLLWQPDVNARLGVRHFADLLASQEHLYHVLASYNAGANRVERWLTKTGTADPEVFVDRIPFVETRDYVRIVTRNREMYRALYRR